MAFIYFARKIDVVVVEVGLGGRLDATNAACGVIGSTISRTTRLILGPICFLLRAKKGES
jgi:folylpolyglutamate synthase/dihydropteroate synthase